jgi:hypothetical protein
VARLRVSLLLLTLGLLGPPAGVLAWPPNGVPVCVQPGYDVNPQVVPDGNGGAFIFWGDGRPSPTSPDFFIQRLTPSGERAGGWPVNGLPVFLADGDQSDSQYADNIIPDGEGGCLVAWLDYRTWYQPGVPTSWDIYAQRITPTGAAALGWPVDGIPVSTQPPHFRSEVTLASDGAGGAIIVWEDSRSGNPDIYAQRLTALGARAPGWPEHGLPICTLPGDQYGPHLIPDGAGGAVITFAGDGTIYVVRITAGGEVAPGWVANGKPVLSAPGVRGVSDIVSDGVGGAYLACQDARTAPPGVGLDPYIDIYVQRITGDGEVAAGWPADGLPVCTEADPQRDVQMIADGFGNAILVWEDYRGVDSDAYAQKLTPGGAIAPGWTPGGTLVSISPAYEFNPRLASDGLGGAYLAYESWTGISKARAQHLTAQGVPAPGWSAAGAALADTPGEHQDIEIVADGLGGAIVAWDDTRAPGGDYDIYAHRLAPDGVVAVQLSLVSAEAEPKLVRLVWAASGAAGLVATVERRTELDEWRILASITADGTGKLVYEDHAATPGTRYAYRLSYSEGDGTAFTTETWVMVPAPRFALHGLTPNPSAGDPVVAFSLASDGPASLELFDIHGRLVLSREVGATGVGAQSVQLDGRGRLPAGIYTVRLRQGASMATTRAVIVR